MKKAILLLAAVLSTVCVTASVALQAPSLESSFSNARAALAESKYGVAELPAVNREIAETQPQSVWPLPTSLQWYWHQINADLSAGQAESALAGIKSGMFFNPDTSLGGPLTGITIGKKNNKPELLTFTHTSGNKQVTVSLPITSIKELRLNYATAQAQGNKWLVLLLMPAGNLQVYFKTEAEARSFMDAAASCPNLAGTPMGRLNKMGFLTSDLTPAQAEALGKKRIDNALLTSMAYDGPAEKAGLLFLDLITAVDGVNVRNADHLYSLLEAAAPGTILKLGCLERTEVTIDAHKDYVWKQKTIELKID